MLSGDMARDRKREMWESDLQARQRNIVFPDTVTNAARFWRNFISGRQRLTAAQAAFIAIFGLTVVGFVVMLVRSQFDNYRGPTFGGGNALLQSVGSGLASSFCWGASSCS